MNRERRRGGFTLVELMITIAIIGVMLGVVFLKLDHMLPGQRLASSGRELVSALDQARNYAVVSGYQVKFEYDIDEGRYRYYMPFEFADDHRTILGDGVTELLDWVSFTDGVTIKDIVLPQDGTIEHNVVTVTFEPRGIASEHVVHLQLEGRDDPQSMCSIVVNPLLGFIDLISDQYFLPETVDKSAF